MFKIQKDGEVIAITEKLNYIKQSAAGVFVGCAEADAQGIAVQGTAYNLIGREAMAGCETVIAFHVDGGACIKEGDDNQVISDALVVDHEYRLTLLELGVTE